MQKSFKKISRAESCEFLETLQHFECVTLSAKPVGWVCSDCDNTFAHFLIFDVKA